MLICLIYTITVEIITYFTEAMLTRRVNLPFDDILSTQVFLNHVLIFRGRYFLKKSSYEHMSARGSSFPFQRNFSRPLIYDFVQIVGLIVEDYSKYINQNYSHLFLWCFWFIKLPLLLKFLKSEKLKSRVSLEECEIRYENGKMLVHFRWRWQIPISIITQIPL